MKKTVLRVALVVTVLASVAQASHESLDFVKLADPSTLPGGTVRGVDWCSDGDYLAVASVVTPFLLVYHKSGTTAGATLTKLANPATLPAGSAYGVAWTSDCQLLAVANDIGANPGVTFYSKTGTGASATLTKIANPAAGIAGNGRGVGWTTDDAYVTIAHQNTPFVTTYFRSGTTFTKLADPASTPGSNCNGAQWSSLGVLALGCDGGSFANFYTKSGTGASATLTKLGNPAALPPNSAAAPAWTPNGDYVSLEHVSTPFEITYYVSGTTFTKLANPASLMPNDGGGGGWSPNGEFVAFAHANSPRVTVYEKEGATSAATLTKLTPNPVSLPTGDGHDADWSPAGGFVAVGHEVSPFFTVYFTELAGVGSVTFILSTIPTTEQEFDFTSTISACSSFTLDTTATTPAVLNSRTCVVPIPGAYSLDVGAVPRWFPRPSAGECTDGSTLSAIAVAEGEDVTCYVNMSGPRSLVGPEGMFFNGDRAQFAADAMISEDAANFMYGILFVVLGAAGGGTFFGLMGAAGGGVLGYGVSLGLELLPIWSLVLVLIVLGAFLFLVRPRGGAG